MSKLSAVEQNVPKEPNPYSTHGRGLQTIPGASDGTHVHCWHRHGHITDSKLVWIYICDCGHDF